MKETNKGPFFGNIFVNQSYYSNIFQLFCVSFCRDFLLFSFCLYNFFCRNILFIALPFFYMTIFFRLDNEIWFNKKLFQKLCKNEWKLNVRQKGFFFFFSKDAKIAMVLPLNKGTSEKNDISNTRPLSTLTTFSKIYERGTKKMIDTAMDKYVSPFISAYRQNYMSGMFWFICWKNGGNA